MTTLRTIARRTLAGALALAIVLWAVLPGTDHAPWAAETAQERVEAVAEHGHAHDPDADLYWALHGHAHDAADHDHSPAGLALARASQPFAGYRDAWRLPSVERGPAHQVFRIERPPRA